METLNCWSHEETIHADEKKTNFTNLFMLPAKNVKNEQLFRENTWRWGELNPNTMERWWINTRHQSPIFQNYFLIKEITPAVTNDQVDQLLERKRVNIPPRESRSSKRKCATPDKSFSIEMKLGGVSEKFTQTAEPIQYTSNIAEEMFLHLGFIVVRFATGDYLAKCEQAMLELAQTNIIESIFNGTEQFRDLGRIQAQLRGKQTLPVTM